MDQFSPAELAELALLADSLLSTQFQYWTWVTFAVVVAVFTAGSRLTQNLRYAVAALYLLATFVLTSRFYDIALSGNAFRDGLLEAGIDVLLPVGWSTIIARGILFGSGTLAALYFLLIARKSSRKDRQASHEVETVE